jgi:hypothetical protein
MLDHDMRPLQARMPGARYDSLVTPVTLTAHCHSNNVMTLFLDFDGVLHPFSRPHGPLVHVPHFEHVLRDFPDVDIVISSAWREAHSLEQLRAFFSEDIAQRIVGVTPQLDSMKHPFVREAEIVAWLRDAGRADDGWIALDDIASFFSPWCANLLLVDNEVGFDKTTESELRRRLSHS